MPGFHNRCTGMLGLNPYSMPGSATCDTGHKASCPVSAAGLAPDVKFSCITEGLTGNTAAIDRAAERARRDAERTQGAPDSQKMRADPT